MGSSPHTRGLRLSGRWATLRERIIPAYAGPTASCFLLNSPNKDHPRIRGAYFFHSLRRIDTLGSSPHTRGLLSDGNIKSLVGRIIPAYAGPTDAIQRNILATQDHPRIRGAYPVQRKSIGIFLRIIPAYAGPTSGSGKSASLRKDHPRIRGAYS